MAKTRASRPIGVVLAALAVALAAVALVVVSGGPAEAKKPKFRVVTRTFSNPTPILPGDGNSGPQSPYPSSRSVSGLTRGKILDVNVTLKNLDTKYPNDIDAVLIGPGRTGSARIMSDVGADGDEEVNGNIVVDDEARAFMPNSNSPLRAGRFKPSNYPEILDPFPGIAPNGNRPLSVFDGKNPNGNWRLFVVDDTNGSGVQFTNGWSVTIKAKVKR